LSPFPSSMRRCVGIRPARARGTFPSPRGACPRPRPIVARMGPVRILHPASPRVVVTWFPCRISRSSCDFAMQCARAVRHKRLESTSGRPSAAAEPDGFRVAHCQGTRRPNGLQKTQWVFTTTQRSS
jgi:hypothetical protein